MCRHSNSDHEDPRAEFYEQLQSAAKAILVLFALGVFLNQGFFKLARIVFFVSAIFLGLRYLKVVGLPGTNGWLIEDLRDWMESRCEEKEKREGRKIEIDDRDMV